MNIWMAEIWHAWRASFRKPGFLLLAAGVLTLGIGASVAVFALINQVLMQPLPLPNPSRVVVIAPLYQGQINAISPQQYQHLQKLHGVESMGLAFSGPPVNISGGGRPEVVSASDINRGMLPALGLHPVLGRNFTAREDVLHGPHVLMLGYDFWQRHFNGDPKVLGQTMLVKGSTYTIVGVLPKSFGSVSFSADVVMPLALPANSQNDGTNYVAVARLSAGTSTETVKAEVTARMHAMYAAMNGYQYRNEWLKRHFGVQPLGAWQNADAHAKLTLFMACALFVLLTALVNLVNLMLMRSLSRSHDSAVRGALGAPPLRLALPALAEGLLIGLIGALVGTGLAALGLDLLQGVVSADWLPEGGIHVSAWIWVLALAVAVTGAVLAAALGVWRSQRTSATDELREGGRSGLGRHGGRLGRVLVMAQMVMATVLLCATGLLLHGMYQAASTPLGFTSRNVLTFDLAPVHADYPDAKSVDALSQRLVRRLETIPGITTATVTTNLPVAALRTGQLNLPAHKPGGQPSSVQYRGIGPGFFKLFRVSVLRGRVFTHGDVRGGEPVAVVNKALAQHMFGGHALGKIIKVGGTHQTMLSARIVGIVGNTRQFGPLKPAPGILYTPLVQVPDHLLSLFRSFEPLRFALGGRGNANQWRGAVRAAMTEVAPNQPISNFRSVHQIVRATLAGTRMTLLLIGIFAALALLLAVAGLYAVMAVAVAAREKEFGVRMALGAAPSRLMGLVLRGGVIQIVVGLVVGVVIVLAVSGQLTRLLLSLTGRGNALDPAALIGVCIVLAIAGLLACLIPALRAGRVQPMQALRGE